MSVRELIRPLVPARLKPPLKRLAKRAKILRHRDLLVRFVDPERDRNAIRRRLLRLKDAADNGIEWALRELQTNSISSADDLLSSCYKGVWSLSLAGREKEAQALLERIAPLVSPEGDVPAMPENPRHYIYRESFLAIGADEVGDKGLFDSLANFVTGAQDPRTGGFWSLPPKYSERWIDSASTSVGGLVLLRRGDLDSATGAASSLSTILHSQPAPREVFYTTMGEDGNLIADPSLPMHRAIHVALPDRPWFFLGLASIFLSELYKHTGEKAHLELSIAYIDYLRRGTAKDRYFVTDAGKTAVATAELYKLTSDKTYAHISLSTSAFIVAKQFGNGRWSYGRMGKGTLVTDMDLTFEYALWLRRVANSIATSS